MSETTPTLALPLIQPSQAQKHVTHNEALRILDIVTQLSAASASVTTPPVGPVEGDRYVVGSSASGDWAGQEDALAVYENGGWQFFVPDAGWSAWIADEGQQRTFDGTGWVLSTGFDTLPQLGISTNADAVNRFAVSSDATLLTHDGDDHRLKINKASSSDVATLLYQSNWSGRAEMGLSGSDDFQIKTSADGSSFQTSMVADHVTGEVSFPSGVTGIAPTDFGAGPVVSVQYSAAKGVDLVANGTCQLGNGYNYPAIFTFDAEQSPNLPGSMQFEGPYPGVAEMQEFIAVDPNQAYRISSYVRQTSMPGDWSAFANEERHQQYMGLLCYDVDNLPITANQHMRFKDGTADSLTTLAAPLTPGDTEIQLVDASGWNDISTPLTKRGVVFFEYKNSLGFKYDHYSRIVQYDLFELVDVDKVNNTITLNKPFPTALANPDDQNGTWPAGSKIANSDNGGSYKYVGYSNLIVPETNRWYHVQNVMGGLDLSGRNNANNFAPGTSLVRPFWLPNYSNRPGGHSIYPDTGVQQKVSFAGLSIRPEPNAVVVPVASGATAGANTI